MLAEGALPADIIRSFALIIECRQLTGLRAHDIENPEHLVKGGSLGSNK